MHSYDKYIIKHLHQTPFDADVFNINLHFVAILFFCSFCHLIWMFVFFVDVLFFVLFYVVFIRMCVHIYKYIHINMCEIHIKLLFITFTIRTHGGCCHVIFLHACTNTPTRKQNRSKTSYFARYVDTDFSYIYTHTLIYMYIYTRMYVYIHTIYTLYTYTHTHLSKFDWLL